ncbi:hypothetical protein ACFLW9_02595 [Chloroflexota bacterium]
MKTSHGIMSLPAFFPTVGWPGGRGEYDNLFSNLEYFCRKINHYHFLFNYSSFIFGFTIPPKNFNAQFETFKGKDIRRILTDDTGMSSNIEKDLIILLDVGGNRIFNKIIYNGLQPTQVESYKIYLEAYEQFIKTGLPDIFVSFDIGPSYTTKDEISKRGVSVWNKLSKSEKDSINHELLKISISFKNNNDIMMVPVNGSHKEELQNNLEYLYNNYRNTVDIIGIAGIANASIYEIKRALEAVSSYRETKNWNIKIHGLGLGGWGNIPLLVKYGIDSCDVASPWRRACTDSISEPYLPLFDKDLNFTDIPNAFSHSELYDETYSKLQCLCPFCEDFPMSEIKKRCERADKRNTGKTLHGKDFREMRIRVYFHNVYQHIALLKKLHIYKTKHGQEFMTKFLEDMPAGPTKNKFCNLMS